MKVQMTATAICVAIGALSLGGCATEKYVDEQIAGVNSRHQALDGRVSSLESGLQATNSRLDGVAQTAQGAAKAAEGKLIYTLVSESDQVTFDTAKWKLSPESEASLTAFAERLKTENKNVYIELVGHGDPRGSVMSNRILGEKRALEVRRFLASQGIPLNHMETVSWGEERQPGADNSGNRVVVLRVLI